MRGHKKQQFLLFMGQSLKKKINNGGETGHAALLHPKTLNARGVCPCRLLAIGELALMVAEDNLSSCSWFHLSWDTGGAVGRGCIICPCLAAAVQHAQVCVLQLPHGICTKKRVQCSFWVKRAKLSKACYIEIVETSSAHVDCGGLGLVPDKVGFVVCWLQLCSMMISSNCL